ncbi:MAG: PfkB family carbohydrate kinase [Zavarzinella sp.]
MLDHSLIEGILDSLSSRTVGLIGDLFLDRYLDIDAALNEPSIETGLTAYQVVQVRPIPGALGTILNNLLALGVGRVLPVTVIGDDGEGYELRQQLQRNSRIDLSNILIDSRVRTPTYTKPMLHSADSAATELHRLDIKNRTPLPVDLELQLLERFTHLFGQVDAWLVLDQVSEQDCGVITTNVRQHLGQLALQQPNQFVLADSRARIADFQHVCIKPNHHEAARFSASSYADSFNRTVFVTQGDRGIVVQQPHQSEVLCNAFPVTGPIDTVGAGDSTSAGIACAWMYNPNPCLAAAFGNLIASITIQQLGTTGCATPQQVRARWQQLQEQL